LQVLEPDFLDSSKQGKISDNHWISYGVEYIDSVPVAYWLFDEHPGDSLTYSKRGEQSRRVSAAEVIHYFKPTRPGQTRGVTDFAPVMLRLRAIGEYDDAEVMRKRIAACLAAFVTTPAGLPGASVAPILPNSDGDRIEQFRPGMIGYLKPGEGVEFSDPRPSSDYEPFNKVQLRAIAAGLGMPYELLTGDLSEVNYTSHRGGLVQFRGMIEADQWQLVVPQVCRPLWQSFINAYRVVNGAIDPETQAEFTPPRFGLLDPAKEIPAMVAAIQSGIDSYPNVVRREGYDWREKIDEAAEALAYAKEKGMEGLLAFPQKPPPPPAAPPPPKGNDESPDEGDDTEEDEDAEAA
jgi:lambda family phage portal protein